MHNICFTHSNQSEIKWWAVFLGGVESRDGFGTILTQAVRKH